MEHKNRANCISPDMPYCPGCQYGHIGYKDEDYGSPEPPTDCEWGCTYNPSKAKYESPFTSRYASDDMRSLFSPAMKFQVWRELWVILAKAEKELGLPITDEQIAELEAHINIDDLGYKGAEELEEKTHHDVMAHIMAYGQECPNAAGIIHLGATSSYVTDNTDVIIMKTAMEYVRGRLKELISVLSNMALDYKEVPTLAYTHYQPAQPTTIGKRICMWIQDFKSDLQDLDYVYNSIRTLGCKGATGTQASFLKLFDGNSMMVEKLDRKVCIMIGIPSYPITGQTYPRKLDMRIYNVLAGIAVSASKMANDIRLLQHDGEMREPFGSRQVGSSAMAYKRNPLNCEKIVGLSRRVITDSINPAWTASVQWLERTLDDSSNRRLVISEGFLSIDEILKTCIKVVKGLVVNIAEVNKNLSGELSHLMMEDIIMKLVKMGHDRQKVHEVMRRISMSGCPIVAEISSVFDIPYKEVEEMCKPNVGCAEEQVERYLGVNF